MSEPPQKRRRSALEGGQAADSADEYILGEFLGGGAFSRVHRAVTRKTGLAVAVKLVTRTKLRYALIELKAMQRLGCGNQHIICLLGCFEAPLPLPLPARPFLFSGPTSLAIPFDFLLLPTHSPSN